MSTLQARMEELMRETGLTVGQIAKICNVTSSAVTQWKDGPVRSIRISAAARLAAHTPFEAMWIATGAGRKYQNADEHAQAYAPISERQHQPILSWEHPQDLPEGEFIFIPLMDIHVSAGHGKEQVIDVDTVRERALAFRAEWIRKMRLSPAKLVAFMASGDSMEPRIQDGDALVIDTSQRQIMDGKVYALYYEGGERVKRLFKKPDGSLLVRSDNSSKYPDMLVPVNELEYIRIIGRVVHIAGEGGL